MDSPRVQNKMVLKLSRKEGKLKKEGSWFGHSTLLKRCRMQTIEWKTKMLWADYNPYKALTATHLELKNRVDTISRLRREAEVTICLNLFPRLSRTTCSVPKKYSFCRDWKLFNLKKNVADLLTYVTQFRLNVERILPASVRVSDDDDASIFSCDFHHLPKCIEFSTKPIQENTKGQMKNTY